MYYCVYCLHSPMAHTDTVWAAGRGLWPSAWWQSWTESWSPCTRWGWGWRWPGSATGWRPSARATGCCTGSRTPASTRHIGTQGGFAHQAEEDRPEGQVADQEDDHQETHHTRQSLLSRYVTLDPGPGLQPQYCQRVIKEIRHGGVCCPRLSCEHQRETQRLFDGELFSWCVQWRVHGLAQSRTERCRGQKVQAVVTRFAEQTISFVKI